jgi:hypothetical protein
MNTFYPEVLFKRANRRQLAGIVAWCLGGLAALALLAAPVGARVLDDFSSDVRFGWNDFTFGLGSVTQAGGQLALQLPASIGHSVFIASARTTEWFPVQEGQPLEFSVDLVNANSPDTFAVLTWVPEAQPVTAFAGYFIAKSSREIRVGKSIHKYFYRATPSPSLKSQNVTLVLHLTGTNGNVSITAKLLDLELGGVVLFDKTFADTRAADALESGTDDPAGPYLGRGRFVLMAYAELEPGGPDPREVDFTNAVVSPPAPAHLLPVIHDIRLFDISTSLEVGLANRASFIDPVFNNLFFEATSDEPFKLDIGGFVFVKGDAVGSHSMSQRGENTLLGVGGFDRRVNTQYHLALLAKTPAGASSTMMVSFDTFSTTNPVIEAEDYNFGGGQFIDWPALTAEGAGPEPSSYRGQAGIAGLDFAWQESGAASRYRPSDPVGTKRSLDYVRPKFIELGGSDAGIYDYDVFGMNAGDYLNYTRTFTNDFYEVYLRESLVNVAQSVAALELVTSNPGQTNQATLRLGYFLGQGSDFLFRNVPLTDDAGNKVVVRLGGVETLRLEQVSFLPADGEMALNYLVLVPVSSLAPVLESAALVTGPYQAELGARVDVATATIRLPIGGGNTRFYRLRAQVPLRITSVRVLPVGAIIIGYGPATSLLFAK